MSSCVAFQKIISIQWVVYPKLFFFISNFLSRNSETTRKPNGKLFVFRFRRFLIAGRKKNNYRNDSLENDIGRQVNSPRYINVEKKKKSDVSERLAIIIVDVEVIRERQNGWWFFVLNVLNVLYDTIASYDSKKCAYWRTPKKTAHNRTRGDLFGRRRRRCFLDPRE